MCVRICKWLSFWCLVPRTDNLVFLVVLFCTKKFSRSVILHGDWGVFLMLTYIHYKTPPDIYVLSSHIFTLLNLSNRFLVVATGSNLLLHILVHWVPVTHVCVSKTTIIGSDNGLSPGRRQAIICTDAEILLIEPLETNFNEMLFETHTFSFKKIRLKCLLENDGHFVSASMC